MSNAKIVHLKASRSVFAAAGGRIGLFGYEEEAGTMRFQYGASPTVDVAYAALRNSPNTFSGANTFQTVTVRDVIVHNQSGTSQSIGYVHSTSGNLRLITRFDETVDSFDFVTRNDDGTSRNTALRIPRTTATAVNAGGSGGQPWNFTGGIWTGGTQRISSAGRFDALSIYNSAWAGSGVRPLLTDNAGMGYATDAATFRTAIGAQGSLGGAANSFVYTDGAGNVVVSNNDTPKTLSHTSSRFQTDDGVGYWTMMAYSGNLDFRKGSSYAAQSVAARMTLTSFDFPSGGTYKIGGVQVVTSRSTGWVAMTGSSNSSTAYDTSSVTLVQLAGRVMALQAALTTHGLIGA